MSWIKNITRFAPFSNKMGSHVWIPYTEIIARIFPTRLELETEVIDFDLHGPIEGFTVFLDGEHGKIRWHLKTSEGFISFYLYAFEEELHLELRKGPVEGIRYRLEGRFKVLKPRESLLFPLKKVLKTPSSFERLSFGFSKKQQVEEIYERKEIEEFLPICYFLSQMALCKTKEIKGGIGDLLKELDEALAEKNRKEVSRLFHTIFSLGFYDLFTPTLEDRFHQRLTKTEVKKGSSPFHLLPHLYTRIRSCFIKEEKGSLHLLPCLPTKTVAGRLTEVEAGPFTLNLEWRKEEMRRMTIESSKKESIELHFPKETKSYRLRKHFRDKGQRIAVSQPVFLEPGITYYFDCFMK